jgi:hypothetical protein
LGVGRTRDEHIADEITDQLPVYFHDPALGLLAAIFTNDGAVRLLVELVIIGVGNIRNRFVSCLLQ